MKYILRVSASVLFAAVLAACGGGGGSAGGGIPNVPVSAPTPTPTPTPMPTPSGATESTQQFVSASQGGNVQLPSGTTIAIPPNALPSSMNVEVATVPKPMQTPSNSALQPSSPAVYVAFSASSGPSGSVRAAAAYRKPMGSTTASNITVTLPSSYVPGSSAAAFVTAIVSICSNSGCIQEGPQIQVDGLGNYFLTIASGLFAGNVPQWLQVVISKTEGIYQPGLRYFDPKKAQWTTDAPPTAVHPILLLHGLASSVEDTFNPFMVQQLMANGGYDVVIGYDYNCFETTDKIVPDIAADVGGYTNLDILAHSEGTLVALDLVPQIQSTRIDNMILIEGPLDGAMVDLGSSVANGGISDARTLFMSMVEAMFPSDSGLVLPAGLAALDNIQGAINGALSDSWFQEFTPGSSVLQGIQSRYAAAANKPTRVILAAGGTSCANDPNTNKPSPMCAVTAAYQKIMNAPFPTSPQNDGIIPSASEQWSGMTSASKPLDGTTNGVFALPIFSTDDHTTLVDNLDDQGAIAKEIEFQFNNAAFDGIYYDTPSVFMKGQDTQTELGTFGDFSATWWYTNLCCGITADKTQAPEAADQFSLTAANFITFTLSTQPADGTAIASQPNDAMPLWSQEMSNPNSQAQQINTFNVWTYPDCTFCNAKSVTLASRTALAYPAGAAALRSAVQRNRLAQARGAKPIAIAFPRSHR